MIYDVEFKPRALKDLKSLPKLTQRRIIVKESKSCRNDLAGDVKRLT